MSVTAESGDHSFDTSNILRVETLQLELVDALCLLKNRCVEPDEYTIHQENIPFGRYAESKLNVDLVFRDDDIYGEFTMFDPNNMSNTFSLSRDDTLAPWVRPDGTSIITHDLARIIRRSWPIFDQYASEYLELISNIKEIAARDIVTIVDDVMRPFAENVVYTRTYCYNFQRVDDTGSILSQQFSLIEREHAGVMQTMQAIIVIPYELNGIPTTLSCGMQFDSNGSHTITSLYTNPETGEKVEVKPNDPDEIMRQIQILTLQLVDGKLSF